MIKTAVARAALAVLAWLTPINAWASRVCLAIAILGLFGIVADVAIQVFGRYVLNDTPTWAESLALVFVLYVTMLGAAVGVRDAAHIGMESLLVLLPDRIRVGFEVGIYALVAVFGAVMAWNGGILAASVMPYKIPTLGLPEGLNHVPLVISGCLMVVFCLEHVLALAAGKEVEPAWH